MSRLMMPFASLILIALSVACTPAPDSPQARQRKMFGLLEKFDRFDENGDGYLTRRELDAGARQIGVHLTPAEIDQVMAAYDRNRDRRISLHEAEKGAAAGPGILEPR